MADADNTLQTEISAFVSPETDAAFKSFDDKMKRLETTAEKLDTSFTRIFSSTEKVAKSLDRATRSLHAVARGTANSNKESNSAATGNTRLAATAGGVATATNKATDATTRSTRAKSENTRATERQRKEEERLSKWLEKRRPGNFKERAHAFGDKASSFGNTAGVVAAGAGAGIGAIAAKGMEIDKTLTYIGITAGATDKEMEAMRKRVRQTSDLAIQSSSDVANALSGVVAANVGNLTNALDISNAAAHAATAADATVDDMAKTYVAAFQQMDVRIEDIVNNRAGDVMATAGKLGKFELKDMSQYFPSILANAKGMGAKGIEGLAQVSAQMQIMMKGAGSASEAATNWMNVFPKLQSPEALKNLKDKFNIDLEPIIKETQAKGGDVALAMAEAIKEKTKGDVFRLKEISSDMQFGTALFTFLDNIGEYKDIVAQSSKASGTIAADEKRAMAGRFMAVKSIKKDMENITNDLAVVFAPAISKVAAVVNFGARSLSWFTDKFPTLSAVMGSGTVAVVAFVAVAAVVSKVVGGVARMMGSLSRAMLMFTERGRRFLRLTDYRGGYSGRGTYMSGFGRGGGPRGRSSGGGSGGGGGRRSRGGGRRSRGGGDDGLVGTAAEAAGYGDVADGMDIAGDVWDNVKDTRFGRRAKIMARRLQRNGGRMLSRGWNATRGFAGRAWQGARNIVRMPTGQALSTAWGATRGFAARGLAMGGNLLRGGGGMIKNLAGGVKNLFTSGGVRTALVNGGRTVANFFTRSFGGTALRALPAILGKSVGAASVGAVGATVAAGAVLGWGIGRGLDNVVEKVTGKSLTDRMADTFTKGQTDAIEKANVTAKSLHEYSSGVLRAQVGKEADDKRRTGIELYKAELAKLNEEIAKEGSTSERELQKRVYEMQVKKLQNQLDGTDPVGKNAASQGKANAGKQAGGAPTVNDHSNIAIEIVGGPNMSSEEMAKKTAEAIADATRKARQDENKFVRGAYADGTATKG